MVLAIRFTYCTDTRCTTLEAQKQRSGNQKNRRIRSKPSMFLSKILYQIVCVFSQMKDTKHILSPGSCPRGGSLGHWGYSGGSNIFFKHGHVAYQINGDDEQNKMQATFLS